MDKDAYFRLTGFQLADVKDNWKGICPVHSESTPSFFIHKETLLCHCFGCGVKGYIDTVLAKAYELKSDEVRKQLQLSIEHYGPWKPRVDVAFNRAFLAGFKRISMHPFLKKRGFNTDTVTLHCARWDPDGRIVFPLKSIGSPDVLGAVGRTVSNHDKKWYFYENTRKGNLLYQALDTLRLDVIVEGIFDVMWLNQWGHPGAAALLGSEASKYQIDLIKRNTNQVTLFLDNDEAGRIGQERLANALKSTVKVSFVDYPEGKKDPQELTREELDIVMKNTQTYVEKYARL